MHECHLDLTCKCSVAKSASNELVNATPTVHPVGLRRALPDHCHQRQLRSYRLLNECHDAVLQATDEARLAKAICRILVDVGKYELVWCGVREEHGSVHLAACASNCTVWEERFANSWSISHARRDLIEVTMRSGQIHSRRGGELLAHTDAGGMSSIAFPLAVQHGVIGAIVLAGKTPAIDDRDELTLLQRIAGMLAYGLNSLRTRATFIAAEQKIDFLLHFDALTNLPNRTRLRQRFEIMAAMAESEQRRCALLYIDLDDFRQICDGLPQNQCEQLLRQVAERIYMCIGDRDLLSHLGGDDFAVLLSDANDLTAVDNLVNRIHDEIAKPQQIGRQFIHLSVSIGISIFPENGREFDILIQGASTACSHAREHGGNTYKFLTNHMRMDPERRFLLINQLRTAVRNREFILHYQPQIDLKTGRVSGVEALVRWQHKEKGMMSPATFIPLAEKTGIIVQIGEWVLNEACRQMRCWHDEGMSDLVIAVNLSALQFKQGNLLETVQKALNSSGLRPECLELELTESILIQDWDTVIKILQGLKELGVKLSIDDFGTGYSSLAYLKRLNVDKLKIDQSFTRDLGADAGSNAIVKTIIQLGQALGLTVIAEGVETDGQAAMLSEFNCNEGQGYLFGRPVSAGQFIETCLHRLTSRDAAYLRTPVAITTC